MRAKSATKQNITSTSQTIKFLVNRICQNLGRTIGFKYTCLHIKIQGVCLFMFELFICDCGVNLQGGSCLS